MMRVVPGLLVGATVLIAASSVGGVRGDGPKRAHRFPDFNIKYLPPESEYSGPLFRLSQDFPGDVPAEEPQVKDILSIPYDQNGEHENWKKYLLAVRDYC